MFDLTLPDGDPSLGPLGRLLALLPRGDGVSIRARQDVQQGCLLDCLVLSESTRSCRVSKGRKSKAKTSDYLSSTYQHIYGLQAIDKSNAHKIDLFIFPFVSSVFRIT